MQRRYKTKKTANAFDKLFTSMGPILSKTIPKSKKQFKSLN